MNLYHLTSRTEWQAAQEAGMYTSPTLDSAGFIHASTVEQVIGVANAFYQGQHDLVLLVIDTDHLASEVRWEPPDHPDSDADTTALDATPTLFPHIYGAVALTSVTDVLAMRMNTDGTFDLPASLR